MSLPWAPTISTRRRRISSVSFALPLGITVANYDELRSGSPDAPQLATLRRAPHRLRASSDGQRQPITPKSVRMR
jgi:hypothetical protein